MRRGFQTWNEEELRLLLIFLRDRGRNGRDRVDWMKSVFNKVNLKALVARQIKEGGVAMTNGRMREGFDVVWPGGVRWEFGGASGHTGETLWQCDARRAGKLYSRSLFGTREEADAFAEQMREREPDQMFNVEAIKASTVWN